VDVVPDVEYPSADGPMPGYLAVPSGEGPWPGVVVVHDAMGMTTDLRLITVRFVAARDHLSADTRCTGRIGSVGFCMGPGHPSWLRCPILVPWSPATAHAIACCVVRRPGWNPSSALATSTGTSRSIRTSATDS
jgi:hypothetical protein